MLAGWALLAAALPRMAAVSPFGALCVWRPDDSVTKVTTPALVSAIGNTPLVRLQAPGRLDVEVWAKLEGSNPGGSAKDRSAWAMLSDALDSGRVGPGGTIIESSSGNLGMALARLCIPLGINFECVADPNVSPIALATIRALGGVVHMVDEPDPETGELLVARQRLVAELLAERPDAITLDQYSNRASLRAHAEGTMREICERLPRIDEVLAATSTTGTIGGCQAWLCAQGLSTRVIAVDAAGSVLFGGEQAPRQLPGYGAGMVPELAGFVQPDEVVKVAEVDAVVGARVLARREGILTGASGGAVYWALLNRLTGLPNGAVVALILHDFGWGYLDTVHDDDWVAERLAVSKAQLATHVDDLLAGGE